MQPRRGSNPMTKSLFAVFLLTLSLVTPASASIYVCTGTVTYLGVWGDGTVTVSGPGGLVYLDLCQLGGTTPQFSPDACKAAYAQLFAATITGQPATVDFNDSLTCTTQPTWTKWTSAYHVHLGG